MSFNLAIMLRESADAHPEKPLTHINDQPDLLAFMPNWNCLHVQKDVVPALLHAGVTQDQVDDTLIGNPARFFG